MFVQEGNTMYVTMNHYDQMLWGLVAQCGRIADGNQELSFKLSHSNRERNITITNGYWRLLRFEGSFVLPSRKSGALHPPPPLNGKAVVSWGYHDSATTMIVSIEPKNKREQWPEQCVVDSPACLQTASDISTSQVISLQFVNVSTALPAGPSYAILFAQSFLPAPSHRGGVGHSYSLPPRHSPSPLTVGVDRCLDKQFFSFHLNNFKKNRHPSQYLG